MVTVRAYALALVLLLLAVVPALALEWDSRLDEVGVTLLPAQDASQGYWELVSAQYLDEQESQGLHHVFVKLLDEQGNQMAETPWNITYPGGSVRIMSKSAPDWADFAMYDCYFPDREHGAYTAFAGDTSTQSDAVFGMGLPVCLHNSFRLIWQRRPPAVPCAGCQPRAFLPLTRK
jgi:hypothetical protein